MPTTSGSSDSVQSAALQARTQLHYEEFPFDFLTAEDEKNIEKLQPKPFLAFVERYLQPGMRVAEIGCGPGRATLFLVRKGIRPLAVDLSEGSLALARRRAPEAEFLQASNLELPLATEHFDAVISDGVIHHTPDAFKCFCENARILAPGGVLYVGVYRRRRYYYYIYTYLGPPIRWLERRTLGRTVVYGVLLPIYYLVHQIKAKGKRTWRGARNFFYDYIITPQATFHTKEEVVHWGKDCGLTLLEYEENVGNVHAFVFRKCRVPV